MVKVESSIRKYALQNAILHNGKADINSVTGKIMAEFPEYRIKPKEIIPLIKEIVREINQLSFDSQKEHLNRIAPELLRKEKKEKEIVLPELPEAGRKIVMRLAPFPSGPLHIGNARMVILNDEYVKKYGGELILFFDDTIGSEEKIPIPEAYDMIKESLDWLGVDYHKIYYKSDRLTIFYEWAEKLINLGHAYVCECDAETLKSNREKSIECTHRKQSVETNLEKWRKMLSAFYKEGDAILRIKSDMKHKNPAFRDRVLFRISDRKHPRVNKKYRVWPLLEFSWAIDDYLLGVTHILRGKDLLIEDEMESYIWQLLGLKGAQFVHYGMIRVAEAKLSKSKSRAEVEKGLFSGWDDPRTWSLGSLRKRGIQPQTLRNFILSFGISLTDIEVPAENLYSENRKIIDPIANRYFFVPNPVRIEIQNLLPEIKTAKVPNHPDFKERGERILSVSSEVFIAQNDFETYRGKEIRLKDFCNIVLDKKATFTSKENKEIPKIQWVVEHLNVKVIMPDGTTISGYGEPSLKNTKADEIVQFERFGFVRIDSIGDEITAYFAHK